MNLKRELRAGIVLLFGILQLCLAATDEKQLECILRMSDKMNKFGEDCLKQHPYKVINSKNPEVTSAHVDYFICLLTGAGVIKNSKTNDDINYELMLKLIDDFPSPLKDRENVKMSVTGCRDMVKATPAKGKKFAESLLRCILFMFFQTRKDHCDV